MTDYNGREEDGDFNYRRILYLGKKKKEEEPKLNYRKKYQGKEELNSLGTKVMYTPGGLNSPRIYTSSAGNYGGGGHVTSNFVRGGSYGISGCYNSSGRSYSGYGGSAGKGVFAGKSEVEGRKAA
mgnify:CR=1 FL=1